MRRFLLLLRRDLTQLLPGGAQGSATLPLLLFLTIAVLYPFALGPDAALLSRTGGAIIWVAALVASILPLDRLARRDREIGWFDQLLLRGISEELAMAVRIAAHWLSFAPLLLLATVGAAALLGLSYESLRTVLLGLLAGTPGLAALSVVVAAVMAGVRGGTALGGMLFLPLAVPLLVFGAGALAKPGENGLALAAAVSLVFVAAAPFASAAALRAAREF